MPNSFKNGEVTTRLKLDNEPTTSNNQSNSNYNNPDINDLEPSYYNNSSSTDIDNCDSCDSCDNASSKDINGCDKANGCDSCDSATSNDIGHSDNCDACDNASACETKTTNNNINPFDTQTDSYLDNKNPAGNSDMKNTANSKNTFMYRCSACGVVQEGGENPPESCVKCDNSKFYRVK
jgi:hypothetical protein